MPDEELVQYIKKHQKSFGFEKLKSGLLKQGVSEKEINDALDIINEEGGIIGKDRFDLDQRY